MDRGRGCTAAGRCRDDRWEASRVAAGATTGARPCSSRSHHRRRGRVESTHATVGVTGTLRRLGRSLRTPPSGSPARFVVSAPPSATPSPPTFSTELAISPDGRLIAYGAVVDGEDGLYVRHLDRLEGELLPGTAGAGSIFFSPDGTEVGFAVDGTLKKIRVTGGPAITLCPMPSGARGASWGPDDTIIFASLDRLFRISAGGGEPEMLTAPDDTETHNWPEVLPDGRAVLFAPMPPIP